MVDWQAERPVLRVLDRLQQHEQILRVAMPAENEWGDLRALDGNVMALLPVEVIAEHHNDQWIDLVGGTPCVTPSGSVVCSVNDMDADTNRLSVDGRVFTPAGWQVREVLDAGADDVLCVVQRTAERAAEVPEQWADSVAERYHDARSFDIVTISYADGSVRAVSDEPGCVACVPTRRRTRGVGAHHGFGESGDAPVIRDCGRTYEPRRVQCRRRT